MESTVDRLLARLKKLREHCGLTQEAFAESAGISYKYYQAVEAGRKRDLRISTLVRLAEAFGLETWELLAPSEPKVRMPRSATKPPHYKPRGNATKTPEPKEFAKKAKQTSTRR